MNNELPENKEQFEELMRIQVAAIHYFIKWRIYSTVEEAIEKSARPLRMVLEAELQDWSDEDIQAKITEFKKQYLQLIKQIHG